MKRAFFSLLPLLLLPAWALAVTTQSFVIDTSEAFEKGKLEGTAVVSDGRLIRTFATARTPIESAAVAYASITGPDGAVYVSTGNQGNIVRIDGQTQKVFAHSDAALITALVWTSDTLFAGTLAEGKVLAIDRSGKVKEFAKLPQAAHVWALSYDAKLNLLYAATGPEGKLYAIDKQGGAKLVHDDEAEHLLCLGLDSEGTLYAGTSNGARLVRIRGGKASVLYDAPGEELTTLALGPGFVAVASNEFPDADALKDPAARARRSKSGKGKVFSVSLGGGVEELYRTDSAHITALEVDTRGEAVHVGLGLEGRIVRAKRGLTSAVVADADERQIVSLHLNDRVPHFVSSDGVALYRVRSDGTQGQWTSAVLDAKMPARFGALRVRKKGSLQVVTRSGNTEKPDAGWSDWSTPVGEAGPIHSAPARFLQLRATLTQDAELYALEAFYLPQNQPAYVRNVRASSNAEKPAPAPSATPSSNPRSIITLNWDIENPDGDKLRYRLFYRRDGHDAFLPLLQEHELLDKNEYRWETLAVPDGYYRVRVEASDELSTPSPGIEKRDALSAPILVDNHPPTVRGLRVSGGRLSGEASDALGPVSLLELSLDGGHFRPVSSVDGLLDTAQERFEIDLGALATGPHIVSVRASDAARNSSTSALEFTVKR